MPRQIWVFAGRIVILLVLSCRGSFVLVSDNPVCWNSSSLPFSVLRCFWGSNEPAHDQRMQSHPVGLEVWFLVGSFTYFHASCVRITKTLAGLRGCVCSPEPSLVAYAISTIIHELVLISFVVAVGRVCSLTKPNPIHTSELCKIIFKNG